MVGPFPDIDTTDPSINGPLIDRWKVAAHGQNLTVRQVVQNGSRWSFVGTPPQIADHVQLWLEEEASDGFLLTPPVFPHALEDFVSLVVPELQRHGLYRTAYTGRTLRDHATYWV